MHWRRFLAPCLAAVCLVGVARHSDAQPSAPSSGWTLSVRNLTRAEVWRFFTPPPSGGNPDSEFIGNRLQVEARRVWPRLTLTVVGQHVTLAGLPERATGPGPLGTGALYFDQGRRTRSLQQVSLRALHVRAANVGGRVDLQLGRMPYASGAEAASGSPVVESVKRMRLDARLIGEFEWSLHQRTFDGVRADWQRPRWRVTGVAFMPTQGGFAPRLTRTMTDVRVFGASVTTQGAAAQRSQVQGFVFRYLDSRDVTQRPDNTGLAARRADVRITTVGGSAVGTRTFGATTFDGLAWTAVQRGTWFGQDHRAWSMALEAGAQWNAIRWRPWVRAGWLHASGDEDRSDATHGTFFPMLPTIRRYVQTTLWSAMNINDRFVQALLRPSSSATLRLDVHRVQLASPADLWYAGSGATLRQGSVFGYAGRSSSDQRDLGTSVEISADYAMTPRWSVNVFVGRLSAGPVVSGLFRGDRSWFFYGEHVWRWATR